VTLDPSRARAAALKGVTRLTIGGRFDY